MEVCGEMEGGEEFKKLGEWVGEEMMEGKEKEEKSIP